MTFEKRSVILTRLLPKMNKKMILMIWALAWPTMLEQLMQTAVQYIDTAMVGALGTQATAAVAGDTLAACQANSSNEDTGHEALLLFCRNILACISFETDLALPCLYFPLGVQVFYAARILHPGDISG